MVEDANVTDQTYDVNDWYGTMVKNQTLKIIVNKQADFEIVNIAGSLYPDGEDVIEITVKKTGGEEAKDVKLIVNSSDLLSTTDDMSFLSKWN